MFHSQLRKLLTSLATLAILGLQATRADAQTSTLPAVMVKNIDGAAFNTTELNIQGPTIVSFWATWCHPCIAELAAVHEDWDDLREEFPNLRLVAVSIDDARNQARVKSFVNGKGWGYTVLLDQNSDLKRAMSVNNVPHTFLLNAQGEVVWQHTSYTPGSEEAMYEHIRKLARN